MSTGEYLIIKNRLQLGNPTRCYRFEHWTQRPRFSYLQNIP
ncbi:hypothetical protein PMI07_006438 [Rhizobium sp. CF080]|nr:hypothetical protein PMI07_006438 [Rhizobium sp. CF080]